MLFIALICVPLDNTVIENWSCLFRLSIYPFYIRCFFEFNSSLRA